MVSKGDEERAGAHDEAKGVGDLVCDPSHAVHVGQLDDGRFKRLGIAVAQLHAQFELLAVGDLVFLADVPHFGDNLLEGLRLRQQRGIVRLALGPCRNAQGVFRPSSLFHPVPKFFGLERHERVQHLQQIAENGFRLFQRLCVDGFAVGRLDQFQVPAAEVVPHEAVEVHQGFAQAELGKLPLQFLQHPLHARLHPAHRDFCGFRLLAVRVHLPALGQAEGIPNLIGKVAALLAELLIKRQIIARR